MNHYSLEDLRASLEHVQQKLVRGCGNHGCLIRPPVGQGTNSVCHCQPYRIARELFEISVLVERMGRRWTVDYPIPATPEQAKAGFQKMREACE